MCQQGVQTSARHRAWQVFSSPRPHNPTLVKGARTVTKRTWNGLGIVKPWKEFRRNGPKDHWRFFSRGGAGRGRGLEKIAGFRKKQE
jgi:hypothetical protein